MRLIVVLGVLLVLASCSDSDMPENFGLSCYVDETSDRLAIPKSNRVFFEFDFDKNVVIKKFFLDTTYKYQINDKENSISEISQATIVFRRPNNIYTLDRATLIVRQDRFDENDIPLQRVDHKCVFPKI